MREQYTRELEKVTEDLVEMAGDVATAIEHASAALQQADLAVAERVIDADVSIDEMERRLDERCVEILARQGPVAGDLRLVRTALRMSASIERMGDLDPDRYLRPDGRCRDQGGAFGGPAPGVARHRARLSDHRR